MTDLWRVVAVLGWLLDLCVRWSAVLGAVAPNLSCARARTSSYSVQGLSTCIGTAVVWLASARGGAAMVLKHREYVYVAAFTNTTSSSDEISRF